MSIGFVVQPQGISLPPLIDAVRTVNAGVHVIIDEAKAIPAIQSLGAQVIFRKSKDDHAHENFDPVQFVEELHAEAPPGALLHLGNEPGRSNLAQLNRWSLEALKTCARVGRRGVIFNFETGNPEPEQWLQLSDAVLFARAGGHVVGLHEYFDVTVARSTPWHVGRFKNLLTTFGGQSPRIVITELGCAVGYNAYAGWQTIHTQETYARELAAAADVYRPYGIDALVYLLGYWDRTATFDVRGQSVIFNAMAAMNGAEEGDEVVPGYRKVTTGLSGANVRSGPGLKYAPVTVLKTGDWAKKIGATVKADGYTWQPVAVDKTETSHVHGYVAMEIITL